MKDRETLQQIPVTNAAGDRATVIAVRQPGPRRPEDVPPALLYGLGGLVVNKISDHAFQDFQGTTWTADR